MPEIVRHTSPGLLHYANSSHFSRDLRLINDKLLQEIIHDYVSRAAHYNP
jgi:hypothetical protein